MVKTEYITVGKSTFRVEVLKNLTQKDAINRFHYLNIETVKHAYQLCNPKKVNRKSVKKSV
tara:strand:- start:2794 stop:2976 length:183 start_codon:yes stop_codon:yes gene_type:complete